MVVKTKTPNNTRNTNEPDDDGFLKISLVNQAVFVRKKKACPLDGVDVAKISYKNLKLLNKFITERGKIVPARATNLSMKKQRVLTNAIKIARQLALISPINKVE